MWQTVTAPYTANASKSTSHERAFLNQLFAPTFTGGCGRCGALAAAVSIPLPGVVDSVARAGIWSSSGPPSPDWPGASKAERVPIADLVSDMCVRGKATSKERRWLRAPPSFPPSRAASLCALHRWGGVATRTHCRATPGHSRSASDRDRRSRRLQTPSNSAPSLSAQTTWSGCGFREEHDGRELHSSASFTGALVCCPHRLMRKLELLQDLGDYYKKGIGDPNAFVSGCGQGTSQSERAHYQTPSRRLRPTP